MAWLERGAKWPASPP